MSPPEKGDVLVVPIYSQSDEESSVEIQWQQSLRTRTAKFYQPRAKDQTKGNEDVLLYIQDSFYKDENNNNFIGKLPGAKKEGGSLLALHVIESFGKLTLYIVR
jgi:hypothetical protein